MSRILNSPSLMLALAYVIGQGSVFSVQLAARYFGHQEVAGLIVLIVSLVSFTFQFGDFGNQTYVMKEVLAHRSANAAKFIASRKWFAALICSFFAWWSYHQSGIQQIWVVAISLPILGYICGGSFSAFLESTGNYTKIALLNAIPWLFLSAGLTTFLLIDNTLVNSAIATALTITACLTSLRLTRKAASSPVTHGDIDSYLKVIPFIMAPLGGQVWFRYVIFSIHTSIGLSALGAFGIARNIQIAILLSIGFFVRPKVKVYLTNISHKSEDVNFFGVFNAYALPFYISLFISAIVLLHLMLFKTEDQSSIGFWLPILVTIPFTLLGQIASMSNQLKFGARYILITDYSCLAINIIVFLSLVSISPLWAVVASEGIHGLMMIIAYIALRTRRVNSK